VTLFPIVGIAPQDNGAFLTVGLYVTWDEHDKPELSWLRPGHLLAPGLTMGCSFFVQAGEGIHLGHCSVVNAGSQADRRHGRAYGNVGAWPSLTIYSLRPVLESVTPIR